MTFSCAKEVREVGTPWHTERAQGALGNLLFATIFCTSSKTSLETGVLWPHFCSAFILGSCRDGTKLFRSILSQQAVTALLPVSRLKGCVHTASRIDSTQDVRLCGHRHLRTAANSSGQRTTYAINSDQKPTSVAGLLPRLERRLFPSFTRTHRGRDWDTGEDCPTRE
jgi:hypothetical protein